MDLSIEHFCENLSTQFDTIPPERKQILNKLSAYIQAKKDNSESIQLVYICTHNSRRSHFGQIWAAVAATYYHIHNVSTFSGGTEVSAFNIHAINSLKRTGFVVADNGQIVNPKYIVQYGENLKTVCFSKVYNDAANPQQHFVAIMTCSDAEHNCPFIPGVELRIGTTYKDPKAADDTLLQDTTYDERSGQIALECLYVFSLVK
jgi:protein-tyrosine phosphatase/arsenate reductase